MSNSTLNRGSQLDLIGFNADKTFTNFNLSGNFLNKFSTSFFLVEGKQRASSKKNQKFNNSNLTKDKFYIYKIDIYYNLDIDFPKLMIKITYNTYLFQKHIYIDCRGV